MGFYQLSHNPRDTWNVSPQLVGTWKSHINLGTYHQFSLFENNQQWKLASVRGEVQQQ